jgi:muconolactone delta-isomerase
VELAITLPVGTEQSGVDARRPGEAVRVNELAETGRLARLWWLAG